MNIPYFSIFKTEHSNLMEEVVSLRKQVESFSAVQKRLGIIEIENKELHNKLVRNVNLINISFRIKNVYFLF